MNHDAVLDAPLYLLCCLLGAIGPDHKSLRMTMSDAGRYFGKPESKAIARAWKRG